MKVKHPLNDIHERWNSMAHVHVTKHTSYLNTLKSMQPHKWETILHWDICKRLRYFIMWHTNIFLSDLKVQVIHISQGNLGVQNHYIGIHMNNWYL